MLTERDYISGSSVIVPNRKENAEREKQNRKRTAEKKNILNKKQKIKNKKSIMAVMLVFICGFIVISRYSAAYNFQKQLITIKNEQKSLIQANDNLKVEILKVSNFKYIEENAKEKYDMSEPDANNVIVADFSKDNFKEEETSNEQNSMWDRIKQLIINH